MSKNHMAPSKNTKTSSGGAKRRRSNALFLILLSVFTFIWLLPIIWTFITSFRSEPDIQRNLTSLVPIPFTLENWQYVLSSSKMVRWFFNSLLVASVHTTLQILICSIAAYAFARIPFKGKGILYMLVLAGLMVPEQATFIPVYLLFSRLNLHNTYIALIIPGIASAFAVFLLVQFFKGIPKELEEAAFLDGASYFMVYTRIIMPLSGPVLTTLAIFTFLANWNSYLWPLVSATKQDVMTITVGLKHIQASWGFVEFFGRIMAASWVGVTPILIFYFIFQQKIVNGIQLNSGIK